MTVAAGRRAAIKGLACLLLAGGTLAIAPSESARAGELAYKGCISSDDRAGPNGSGACSRLPGVLDSLTSIVLGPEGGSLYTGTSIDCSGLDNPRCDLDGVLGHFDLDAVTGATRYRSCVTGDEGSATGLGCAEADASFGALGAGMGAITSETVSLDGRSLYAGSMNITCVTNDAGRNCYGSNVVTTLDREPATGGLAYNGCVTGDERSGPSGSGSCRQIPSATPDGQDSGLSGQLTVALSSDGRSLYVASTDDSAIARFARNPQDGRLLYRGCVTGEIASGPSGSGACAQIPGATEDGFRSGLGLPVALAVSDDGESLYSVGGSRVARFDRNPTTGALSYEGCITGRTRGGPSGPGACVEIPSATASGRLSGLEQMSSLALSSDGKSMYVAGRAAVARFDRNRSTGAIVYKDCLARSKSMGPSGNGACRRVPGGGDVNTSFGHALALSPDDGNLYTGIHAGIARLKRDPRTGALDFKECVTGVEDLDPTCREIPEATRTGRSSGLFAVNSLASEASSTYAGTDDAAVAHLAIAPQTKIKSGPKGRTRKHRAVLRFRAGERSTFKCKLKGKRVKPKLRRWRRCGSKQLRKRGRERYRHLKRGRKVFKVKATNRANTTDPTAAKRVWRVRR